MWNFDFHNANLAKHKVFPEDVEQCLSDPQKLRWRSAGNFIVIGKTGGGRYLHIAIEARKTGRPYVFQARTATEAEKRQYKSRGK